MSWFGKAAILLAVISVVILGWSMVAGQRACHNRGGDYVRGMVWFECVGESR